MIKDPMKMSSVLARRSAAQSAAVPATIAMATKRAARRALPDRVSSSDSATTAGARAPTWLMARPTST
jgi:hypothetical protein